MRRYLPLMACALYCANAFAWSDHASLLWPLVRGIPAMLEPTLQVETLDAFIEAEAEGIERVLAEHEAWSRATLEHYAPRPDALAFSAGAPATLADPRAAFLAALRVNPTLEYRPYRQTTVEETVPGTAATLRFADLSFLDPGVSHADIVYLALDSGDLVAPAQVLATGSDEPDFGMDIGLFADNGTSFGAVCGFGDQPFGNPNLDYGSQAPFHMGFYHLDLLTRTAQPDLLRTYPQWRIAQYRALAELAFGTGHDYWGWRFMGWALHYIGDLTQPYHAEPLPGVSTAEALWAVLRGRTDEAVQLVSNRHGVLESYQYQRMHAALQARQWTDPILEAIASGAPVPVFETLTPSTTLTAESVAAGAALDAALETYVPARFVADPSFEWTGSGEEAGVVDTVLAAGGDEALRALDAAVAAQLRRFSRYARAWINLELPEE